MTPAERKSRTVSLERQLNNFDRLGLTRDPRRQPLLEELAKLRAGGLAFHTSFDAIRGAAEARQFISYGEIADASNLPWVKARLPMPKHLDDLCIWAHGKTWPLITAIVVERENVQTGSLGKTALKGFLATATKLGFDADGDPAAFLRGQQQAVFDWAARERGHDLHA